MSEHQVMTSNSQVKRVGVVKAAAAVWLIIGVLVLVGVVVGIAIATRGAATANAANTPSSYQLDRPQREDAFWAAYQSSSVITTKTTRTGAVALANQMCAQEGSNPGGIMGFAQSRHYSDAALAETAEMLRLAHGLCG